MPLTAQLLQAPAMWTLLPFSPCLAATVHSALNAEVEHRKLHLDDVAQVGRRLIMIHFAWTLCMRPASRLR